MSAELVPSETGRQNLFLGQPQVAGSLPVVFGGLGWQTHPANFCLHPRKALSQVPVSKFHL